MTGFDKVQSLFKPSTGDASLICIDSCNVMSLTPAVFCRKLRAETRLRNQQPENGLDRSVYPERELNIIQAHGQTALIS